MRRQCFSHYTCMWRGKREGGEEGEKKGIRKWGERKEWPGREQEGGGKVWRRGNGGKVEEKVGGSGGGKKVGGRQGRREW